jgi:DNA-binding SARP family transcriptional activator
MRFSILGPLQLRAGSAPVMVPAARERALLAMLLLHPNQLVVMQQLIGALWDADPPSTARAQVHSCVSRLRRLLRRAGVDEDLIATEPTGYRIRVGADDLDLSLFTRGVEVGRAAAAAGDLVDARQKLRAALGLWRGRPLADVDSAAVRAAAAHLEEQRNAAFEICVDVELRLGLAEDVLAELTDLVERFPHNERLRGQLMTALVHAGRRADALAVYRRGRALLSEDLGIEPGGELEQLHRQILVGDETDVLPVTMPARPRAIRLLPRDVAEFAGRAGLVERLVAMVLATPDRVPMILAIDGMAGMGKTALAVRIAHRVADRYPDAHLFLDLHGHSERSPVGHMIALGSLLRQLGVPQERIPQDLDERIEMWRSELDGRRVLIVLDNARDADQVQPLLPGASTSCTVITSRRRLGRLDDIHPLSLDVLTREEAVELLERMVGSRVAADASATLEVAELCGRLPLALRLAAGRLQHRPTWTVADLAERLRDASERLGELAVDGRTVAAAFTLSYQQLPPLAKRVFRLLGVHPADDLEAAAAAALADIPVPAATRVLEELVDAHLVEAPSAGRYRLHDLLREYAAWLAAREPDPGALPRLVQHYLQSATNATATMESGPHRHVLTFAEKSPTARTFADAPDGHDWLERELSSIVDISKLAEEHGMHREVCLISRALWPFLHVTGYNVTSRQLLDRAVVNAVQLGDPELEATAHNYLAAVLYRAGLWTEALDHLDTAAVIAERNGLQELQVTALSNSAVVLIKLGYFTRSIEVAVQAETKAALHDYGSTKFKVEITLGMALMMAGRYREALAELRKALAMRHAPWATVGEIGVVMGEMGRAHLRMRHLAVAVPLLRRALALKQLAANSYGSAETLAELGTAHRMAGRIDEALAAQQTAYRQMVQVGDRSGLCMVANDLAITLTVAGKRDDALTLHEDVLRQASLIGDRYEQARALAGIAELREDCDAATRAKEMFDELGTPYPVSC